MIETEFMNGRVTDAKDRKARVRILLFGLEGNGKLVLSQDVSACFRIDRNDVAYVSFSKAGP